MLIISKSFILPTTCNGASTFSCQKLIGKYSVSGLLFIVITPEPFTKRIRAAAVFLLPKARIYFVACSFAIKYYLVIVKRFIIPPRSEFFGNIPYTALRKTSSGFVVNSFFIDVFRKPPGYPV